MVLLPAVPLDDPAAVTSPLALRLNLGCRIEPSDPKSSIPDTVVVERKFASQSVKITFKRTIRVSDNDNVSSLPPSCGNFPLYSIRKFASRLPQEVAEKGGLLLPMYKREAMWIDFESHCPFAIKILAGGVNVVSGDTDVADGERNLRLLNKLQEQKSIQDYIVVPHQYWIDGIATDVGIVRQFVATPTGSGYSIEAQMTNQENMQGLQFQVIPVAVSQDDLDSEKATLQINIKTLTGKTISLSDVAIDTAIGDIKNLVRLKEGIPPDQQRLVWCGKQLSDDFTLRDYGITFNALIHLILRLRGGGDGPEPKPKATMNLTAGGKIKQSIMLDEYGKDSWDIDRGITFNVQMLNSDMFLGLTGIKPPPSPIPLKEYSKMGLPFFKLHNEPMSQVKGQFGKIKSVAMMDETNGVGGKDPVYETSTVTLDSERCHSSFKPVQQLTEELQKMNYASF